MTLPRKSYIKANVRLVQLNHVHGSKHKEKYQGLLCDISVSWVKYEINGGSRLKRMAFNCNLVIILSTKLWQAGRPKRLRIKWKRVGV